MKQFKSRKIAKAPEQDDFNILQNKLEQCINPLVDNISNDSHIIVVAMTATVPKTINHQLGRNLTGWEVCRKDTYGDIKEEVSKSPDLTLILVASNDMNISIRVF